MEEKYPPYTTTDKMLNLVSEIMEKVGEANYFKSLNKFPELRKKTRIKSIHSSLAIENNQLSLFELEDIINGKMAMEERQGYGKQQYLHIGKNFLNICQSKV